MTATPLQDLRVLVTRDRAASERLAARLERLGAVPVICPAIEIRLRNPPGLDEALIALDRFDWLVLTSANTVRAIQARCQQIGVEPERLLNRTKIAVVEQRTQAELERAGGRADIVAEDGTAEGLAAALESRGVERNLILFPASRIARPDLPLRLREAGAGVIQLAAYETVAPEHLPVPAHSDIDVATFASPSAIRNINQLVGRGWFTHVPVICIGRTTAAAAREAGVLEPIVANEPSMAGIVSALLEFQQHRQLEVGSHGAR